MLRCVISNQSRRALLATRMMSATTIPRSIGRENGGSNSPPENIGTSSRGPRSIRRSSTSPYPLKELNPSRSIPRLPLIDAETKEAKAYAESSKDGTLLNQIRKSFEQIRPVLAINIPAKQTSFYQNHPLLKDHYLRLTRLKSLKSDPHDSTRRVLLLNIERLQDLSEESQQFLKAEEEKDLIKVIQDEVRAGFEHWGADEILTAILPLGLPEGTPTAFTTSGHLAHVNLRDEYAPYRFIIGQVIMDKNPAIRTVVNKLDTIDNEFRFFKMERLAGEDDYLVTVSESNCTFTFDFRTVYWNSRLHTEHARLLDTFKPFDVISDVMAGVGPFAVPAAKRGCHVLANDLNPSSYESMLVNQKKNKVGERLVPFCEDGRAFIRNSIKLCWNKPFEGTPLTQSGRKAVLESATSRHRAKKEHERMHPEKKSDSTTDPATIERGPKRRLIDHFVMNLPATAIEFLDAFKGAYDEIAREELETELQRRTDTNGAETVWPMVHVHCFTKNLEQPYEDICQRANRALGIAPDSPHRLIPPPYIPKDDSVPVINKFSLETSTPEINLHLVRSVAPNKDMYCLSFRLSREILFSNA